MSSQKFAIERSHDGGVTWEVIAFVERSGTGTYNWQDGGLDPGTQYHYRVRAWDNEVLYSGYSNTANATTNGTARPLQPASFGMLKIVAVPYWAGGWIFTTGQISRAEDWTHAVVDCSFSTNEHGFESLQMSVDLDIKTAYYWYDLKGFWIRVTHLGSDVWLGRVETVSMAGDGLLEVSAYGIWRVFYDRKWTGFLGTTQYRDWVITTPEMFSFAAPSDPGIFTGDLNNRIYMSLNKDSIYPDEARWISAYIPVRENEKWGSEFGNGVSFAIVGAKFNYEMRLPYTSASERWDLRFVESYQSSVSGEISGSSAITHTTINSDGTVQSGTVTITPTIPPGPTELSSMLWIDVYNNGWSGTITNETGYWYVKVTIEYILGAGRFYFSTPVLAGEIMTDIIDSMYSDALGNKTETFIQRFSGTPYDGAEITDIQYEDQYIGDIMIQMANMPDSNGDLYEVAVWDNNVLHFEPRGTNAKRWSVDVSDYRITFDSDSLINRAQVKFKDIQHGNRRTNYADSQLSFYLHDKARGDVFEADTTSLTTAEDAADAHLAEHHKGGARASFVIAQIYTETGAPAAPWNVRGNDILVINNLPQELDEALYEFRIGRTVYNAITNQLDIELIDPEPTTVNVLAQGVSE